MSVFTALPQDMLQYEIARFLTHNDALNWNEVLKNNERVYKKLPADYAIKHQIKISYKAYQGIAAALQFQLDHMIGRHTDALCVRLLKKYFAWFRDPKNSLVFMYIEGRRQAFLELITAWCDDDLEFYDRISNEQVDELRMEAAETVSYIESVPYVRPIRLAGHTNLFEL
jgi:hypothetical protein